MDSMAGEEQYTTQITSPRLQQETVAEEARSGWIQRAVADIDEKAADLLWLDKISLYTV